MTKNSSVKAISVKGSITAGTVKNRFHEPPFFNCVKSTKDQIQGTLLMDPATMTEQELESGGQFILNQVDDLNRTLKKYKTKGLFLWDPRQEATQIMEILYGVKTFNGCEKLKEKLVKQQKAFYLAEAEFHDPNLQKK